MSKVTERIDSVLKERGISKQEFYRECEITSSAYSQWNTGRTEPRVTTLRRIADYLGLNYEWLISGIGEKEKAPTPEGERPVTFDDFTYAMYEESKELTEENKKKLLEMAQFFRQQQEKDKQK